MTTDNQAEPHVSLRVDGGVAWITLANPRRKNALTAAMTVQLRDICDQIDEDESIGAAVIGGEGGYFCSGADTRDLAASSDNPASPDGVRRTSAVYGAFVRFTDLLVPSISVVVGGAVGAGMNLALAADVLLAAEDAVLDSGFLARGIHPGGGHLALLGRALSTQEVMAHAVFGAALTGRQAVARGLAYDAAPAGELDAAVARLVELPAADPLLARRIKASARLELGPPGVDLGAALEIERGVQMWSLARKGVDGWQRPPARPNP
jgi:enoyl-CoA hydratase